jgi:hypothetical protein
MHHPLFPFPSAGCFGLYPSFALCAAVHNDNFNTG